MCLFIESVPEDSATACQEECAIVDECVATCYTPTSAVSGNCALYSGTCFLIPSDVLFAFAGATSETAYTCALTTGAPTEAPTTGAPTIEPDETNLPLILAIAIPAAFFCLGLCFLLVDKFSSQRFFLLD